MERKLIFKNEYGTNEVMTFDHKITETEARHATFVEINRYCKEKNEPVYYVRMWNKDNVTIFDFGSHSDFFMLVPQIDIT